MSQNMNISGIRCLHIYNVISHEYVLLWEDFKTMVPEFLTNRDGWVLLAVFMYGVSSTGNHGETHQVWADPSTVLELQAAKLFAHDSSSSIAQTTPLVICVLLNMCKVLFVSKFKLNWFQLLWPWGHYSLYVCCQTCMHSHLSANLDWFGFYSCDLGNRFGHT